MLLSPLRLPQDAAPPDLDELLMDFGGADPLSLCGAPGGAPLAVTAGLRCLDGTHAPGCTLCAPPPPEGEEGDFELSGLVRAPRTARKGMLLAS